MKKFFLTLFLIFFSASIWSQGLVAYYPFNGNSDDESGNNFNLSPQGSPTLTDDRFGNPNSAYLFNGSTDCFIHTTNDTLMPADEFTLCVWMYTTGIDGSEDNLISTFENTGKSGYQINLDNSLNAIECEVRNTTNYQNINTAFNSSLTNSWVFIVYTYSNVNGTKLYVNAELKSENTTPFQYSTSASDYLRIANNNVNSFFKGKIDDIRIYNITLSDQEILSLYNLTTDLENEISNNSINDYQLKQNFPNPFNPSTVIEFSLTEDVGNVKLSIYNALGEKVAELVNTSLQAGRYQYHWKASNDATGMYIYELRTDKFVSIKKMMLLK